MDERFERVVQVLLDRGYDRLAAVKKAEEFLATYDAYHAADEPDAESPLAH